MDKITIANFTGAKTANVSGIYQYDYGQILRIQGLNLPTAVEIHFALQEKGGDSITRVGITKDGVTDVVIPDSMLENGDTNRDYNIYAFVYLTDDTSGQTEYKIRMMVQSRPRPEAFNRPEDAELFREAIQAVNASAKEAEGWAHGREDMPERAMDNAKYYAGESAKTAESIKGVEQSVKDMVDTIGNIKQQVQDVKEYAGQAQSASEKALLSEQEAKKSENAALQAKADAEAAKGSAETAAGKTASDKTAVESTKEEVLQAERQVSADRAAVEAVERKVAQMGNEIPQAVLKGVQTVESAGTAEEQGIVQTGTTQKSAVESAGTKAVENITLEKKTATEAVETAKAGAVQAVQTEGAKQSEAVTAEGAKQVKAVADKGAEVLQSVPEDFTTQMASKLDKNQGVENKGKPLVVGEDGNVIPGKVQGEGWRFIRTVIVPADQKRDQSGVVWKLNTEGLVTGFAFDTDEKGNHFSLEDVRWYGETVVDVKQNDESRLIYLEKTDSHTNSLYRMTLKTCRALYGTLNRTVNRLYPTEFSNVAYMQIPSVLIGTGNSASGIEFTKKITAFGFAFSKNVFQVGTIFHI